jgi:fibronectin type 3 domain-containing protein
MAINQDIVISNLYAVNLGDGRTVRLSWSVPEPKLVKYFEVQYYNPSTENWQGYDDFHGILFEKDNEEMDGPPRHVDVEFDFLNQNITFRIRACGKDREITEWARTSVYVQIEGDQYAETTKYFVKDGLVIRSGGLHTAIIAPGIAYLGGKRRSVVSDVYLNIPQIANKLYQIYIDINGEVGYAEWSQRIPKAIRLYKIFLDSAGRIVWDRYVDVRFLWAPSNAEVSYMDKAGTVGLVLSWEAYSEPNLEMWRVFRAEGKTEPAPTMYKSIASVDKENSTYEDFSVDTSKKKYWYRLAAVDGGNSLSPFSEAVTFSENCPDTLKPFTPCGLMTFLVGTPEEIHIDLEWFSNTDEILGYYIWWLPEGDTNFRLLAKVDKYTTRYRHTWLTKGRQYSYYITAYNKLYVESDKSETVSCTAGDMIPPKAPFWDMHCGISSGMNSSGLTDCWVKLNWEPVTESSDDTPIKDLMEYRVYSVEDSERILTARVDANPAETEYTINHLLKGGSYTYIVTAVDYWGNESEPSSELSIMAGGNIPQAPVLQSASAAGSDRNKLVFTKVESFTNGLEIGVTQLGYIIYRGISPNIQVEIGRILAADPQPDVYDFIDAPVSGGITYYYSVEAFSGYATSTRSNIISVMAGDTEAPSVPIWKNISTRVDIDGVISNVLEWKAGQENDLQSIYVYFYRGDELGNFELVGLVPKGETEDYSYAHSGLVNGAVYHYKLVAIDESKNRSESVVRDCHAGTALRPAAPVVVAVGTFDRDSRDSGVRLSWDEVAKNEDGSEVSLLAGYKIFRAGTTLEFVQIATIKAGENTYVYLDSPLVNGRGYYYKIISYNRIDLESQPCLIEDVIAGDMTMPLKSEVTLVETVFNPENPALVMLRWRIASADAPGSYKIYESLDGVRWVFANEVVRETETEYIHNVAYGSRIYIRVVPYSLAGVAGEVTERNHTATYTVRPSDIEAEQINFVLSTENNDQFKVALSWEYTPGNPEGRFFSKYDVLYDSTSPRVISSIFDINTKTFEQDGLRVDGSYMFAIVVENVFGLRSNPHWVTVAPEDSTEPVAPGSLKASARLLSVFVEWDRPLNTDGTECFDLSRYILQIADNAAFSPVLKTAELSNLTNSYFFDTNEITKSFFFRIKAVDRYGHESEFSNTVGGVSPLSIETAVGDIAPESPAWPESFSYQTDVEWAKDNDGNLMLDKPDNVWLQFAWLPVDGAARYIVYLSGDGVIYYPRVSTKTISIRLNNLLSNTRYYVAVTAVSKLENESTKSDVKTMKTALVTRTLPSVPSLICTVGKGMLAVQWEPVVIGSSVLDDAIYVLENRYTTDLPGTTRNFNEWTEIYRGKLPYFIHSSLEYDRFYQYRVKCIDDSRNASEYGPAFYEQIEWQPSQIGSEDMAANAVISKHIYSGVITADHIGSRQIEGRHIKAGTVTAENIAAKAIQASSLDVTIGGYNYVRNSAFGMTDLIGNLGIDWSFEGTEITKESGLPIKTEYRVAMGRTLPTDPRQEIVQRLPVSQLVGKQVTVSCFAKAMDLKGDECRFGLRIVTLQGTTDILSEPVTGTFEWKRFSFTYNISDKATKVSYMAYLQGFTIGNVKWTGIKVEEGDTFTQWSPNPDETYGCDGAVQINSAGIRVIDGKINVISTDGSVTIAGNGITAARQRGADGVPLSFARLDAQGLTVLNGAVSISTGNGAESVSRVELDGRGLRALRNGIRTFDLGSDGNLNVYGGTFKFNDWDPAAQNRLEIDNDGLWAYGPDGKMTVSLRSSDGNLGIYGGKFEIKTKGPSGTNEGIIMDSVGLVAYQAGGIPTFRLDSETGDLGIYGGKFTIATAANGITTDALILDKTGIRLYDQRGIVFRAATEDINGEAGLRLLLRGGFKIESPDGPNKVVIDSTGVYGLFENGSSFALSAGTKEYSPGLTVRGGDIFCGDVHLSLNGVDVIGGKGFRVWANPGDTVPVAALNNEGLTVTGGAGIKIRGSGSIVFDDPQNAGSFLPAINSKGIVASAITAGVLTVDGSTGDTKPRIEIKNGTELKVSIDKSGIAIRDGALNVLGPNGQVYVKDGRIQAVALQVGIGAMNLLRNTRGDFGNVRFWNGDAEVSVADTLIEGGSICAGISGKHAFRLQGDAGKRFAQIGDAEKETRMYIFSGWIYLVSGWLRIAVLGSDGKPLFEPGILNQHGQYNKFEFQFSPANSVPVTYEFKTLAEGTLAYITDINVVEGDVAAAWSPHATELASAGGSVLIDDSGVQITNGKFTLSTANAKLSIDETGIHHDRFHLTSAGLDLNFPINKITLDDNNGLVMKRDDTHYVKLDPVGGLQVVGGLVNIQTANGGVTIDDTGIKAVKRNTSCTAELNAVDGLKVVGGAVDIRSALSGSRLELVNDKIVVYYDDAPVLVVGNTTQYTSGIGYGIFVDGGAFRLNSSSTGQGSIDISNNEIVITHVLHNDQTGLDEIYKSVLSAAGLQFKKNGDINVLNYVRNVQIPNQPVRSGTWVPLVGFLKTPKVIAMPVTFCTYNKNDTNNNQYMKCVVTDLNAAGFTPVVKYFLGSYQQYSYERIEGPQDNTLRNSTWIGKTLSEKASSIEVYVEWWAWGASKKYYTPGNILYSIYFSEDGVNWNLGGSQHHRGENASDGSWGSTDPGADRSGSDRYQYIPQVLAPIWIKIVSSQNGNGDAWCRPTGICYLANYEAPTNPEIPYEVTYIAVE